MHKKHLLPPCVGIVAIALLFLSQASARADLISWSYNWEPNATKITADGGGSGHLTLTDEPSRSATGLSNTLITNLRTFSTATTSNPDTFTHADYSFTLHLQDSASNATADLKFTGFFGGTLAANSAGIKLNPTSPTTQQVTLGGNVYTVALGTYSPPGPPGDANAGSLNAVVSVAPAGGGGTISGSGTPEPGSLLLAGLALPWLGLTAWRQRRQRVRRTLPLA
jgi:hypothetical protein